jgi:hypothetical protein
MSQPIDLQKYPDGDPPPLRSRHESRNPTTSSLSIERPNHRSGCTGCPPNPTVLEEPGDLGERRLSNQVVVVAQVLLLVQELPEAAVVDAVTVSVLVEELATRA